MEAVLGFHLLATLIFVVGSAVVAWRLLALAHRSRQRPELLLGLAILGAAVLGYGLLIASTILRAQAPPDDVPAAAIALTAIGKTLHNAGVTCFLLFVLHVFRPGTAWARVLAAGAGLLMWGGMIAGFFLGSLRTELVGQAPWWCEYAVIWSYPVWMMIESLGYWRLMRRRAALGLGDVMVTNRFLLWGVGSFFTAIAIWTASVPFLLLDAPDLAATLMPWIHILTALAGLASISCSYLAFLPPAWYRARVVSRNDSQAVSEHDARDDTAAGLAS